MDNEPLVSVLMTLYNREKYVEEAIESVLNSSYSNFELVIVDDQSSDNSVRLVQKYLSDNKVRFYQNKKNLGDYTNRNKAASYARGEYIMYVDSDDILNETGIEDCMNLMKCFPDCAFGMRHFFEGEPAFEMKPEEIIQAHFFKRPHLHIGPGGTIIKLSFFRKIGEYPDKYGPANDMYFNLKAASATKMVFIPFEFLHYRRHAEQQINNTYSYIYNNYLYLKDALAELELPLTQMQIKWLNKKNKRRFLTNMIRYFSKTCNLKKTNFLIKRTRFSLKDILQALFH